MSETIAVEAERGSSPRLRALLLGRGTVMVYVLVVAVLLASVSIERFATPLTVGFLLLDVIPILLIAMPMTLIIVSGEIDLSVASTVGLSSAVLGVLWADGWSMPAAMAVCVVVGVLAGAFNGFLVAVVGLPSLAVTIGTLALFRGLALVVIGDDAVADFPPAYTQFATEKIGSTGVPVVMVGVVLVVALFAVVLHLTSFGRGLFALGHSTEAARFVGIDVARAKFWLYVAAGVVSAVVGIYWTLRYSSARSDNASGLELSVIAGVLLGGVSIFGGRGTVPGVVAAVLLIGTINYALRLDRVSDVVLIIVTGTLLIASVIAPRVGEAITRVRHERRVRSHLPSGGPPPPVEAAAPAVLPEQLHPSSDPVPGAANERNQR